MAYWLDRIRSIPDWFIVDICNEVYRSPLTRAEVTAVVDFIKSRRDTLEKLILANKKRFPKITTWPLIL